MRLVLSADLIFLASSRFTPLKVSLSEAFSQSLANVFFGHLEVCIFCCKKVFQENFFAALV